jgi:hypothetical protein
MTILGCRLTSSFHKKAAGRSHSGGMLNIRVVLGYPKTKAWDDRYLIFRDVPCTILIQKE